jgi:signal transduction histidine kinase
MTVKYGTNINENNNHSHDLEQDRVHVLVVEDDAHLLSGIRDILELENYTVTTASHGRAGLELLRDDPENPPDVIVSDIMMPYLDGFEFLAEVRKVDDWVTVPFIFLTARGERTDRYKGHRLGADVFLTKPFDANDLLEAVKSSLKRHNHISRVKNNEITSQKRKILTILNHEFRTPLTLVVAYADMLKEFDPDTMNDNEVMSFLRGVNSGADRLRRLVENFITLVELDTGEAEKTIQWRARPVDDLALLVDDAQRQIAMPQERPRNFVMEVEPDLPAVTVDVQYFTIVLRELLDNAAKFSDDGDTVRLIAAHVGDHIEIHVIDDGRGVPASEADNIWKQFYQVKREQYEDQGAGSGLAIVRGLVELHGGTVQVRSTPGQGSTFSIHLPLDAANSETSGG